MVARVASLLLSFVVAVALVVAVHAGLASAGARSATIVISEVAWSGTAAETGHEWIELHNPGASPVDLNGWRLEWTGGSRVELVGTLAPGGFYLLERLSDVAISDIPADLLFWSSSLRDEGDSLLLINPSGDPVDSANGDGGPWPGGTASPTFFSMVRINPLIPDSDDNWSSHFGDRHNGLDRLGEPIQGTPSQPNPGWPMAEAADLQAVKMGPRTAWPGNRLTYTLSVANIGNLTATNVLMTDTLPAGLHYISDTAATSPTLAGLDTLIWPLETIAPAQVVSFTLVVSSDSDLVGQVKNGLDVATSAVEYQLANNDAQASTWLLEVDAARVLIGALHYDGYELNDRDEAVQLVNAGQAPVSIASWRLTDGLSTLIFPDEAWLEPGERIWIAANAAAFRRQFGHLPDYEAGDSGLGLPAIGGGTWPGFANGGDEVILADEQGSYQDVLVYGDGSNQIEGWQGEALQPYVVSGVFAAEGQVLYRKTDVWTGMPAEDTNSAWDWAQERLDPMAGRRARYPGWDLEDLWAPASAQEEAKLLLAAAPDHAFEALTAQLAAAESTIVVETLTMRSLAVASALSDAAARGVSVTVLLEGGPVGGLDDQEKLACQLLEAAGGQCWFMVQDSGQRIFDRYAYLHAKFMVIDGAIAVISSENLSPDSMPNDDKSDGTWGRRGVTLITDSPTVVGRLQALWSADFDPANHLDLRRWSSADPVYGLPSPGTVPITQSGGFSYTLFVAQPLYLSGEFSFEIAHAPENALLAGSGLLKLIDQAGEGDVVLVEALTERPHWGASAASPDENPNPRLQALLEAARRGATVRLLLDDYFDRRGEPLSNWATCQLVNQVARQERLDIVCAQGNPTGLGIHNKMVLVQIGEQGYVHIGSLNGSELSHKGNREVALLVQSNEAFDWLADMFWLDWPHELRLPLVHHMFQGPARHILISEILYDPSGLDDAEFIELVNPTDLAVDLSGYGLGDALNRADFEDLRRLPPGTVLAPGDTLVIATTAAAFREDYGFDPDFEVLETSAAVPNLIDDLAWGDPAAFLQLGNTGDEVLLRDPYDRIVDAIAYGQGLVPGQISCELAPTSGYSLERLPYRLDTDNCAADFRAWPFPSPGSLPLAAGADNPDVQKGAD